MPLIIEPEIKKGETTEDIVGRLLGGLENCDKKQNTIHASKGNELNTISKNVKDK